jgi:hypothetical protein
MFKSQYFHLFNLKRWDQVFELRYSHLFTLKRLIFKCQTTRPKKNIFDYFFLSLIYYILGHANNQNKYTLHGD